MEPVRIVAGGNRREGTAAIPGAGRRGRAGISVLAAAAGLAVLAGTVTGTTAARAAAPASARSRSRGAVRPAVRALPLRPPGLQATMLPGLGGQEGQ